MPKPSVASLQAQLSELRQELKEARSTQRASILERPRQVEDLDLTPVALPVDFDRPPTIQQLVAQYVQGSLSAQAAEEGYGTFEEEDDFEPEEEELLPLSGFEVLEMAPDTPPGEPEADAAPPEEKAVEAASEPPEAASEPEAPTLE